MTIIISNHNNRKRSMLMTRKIFAVSICIFGFSIATGDNVVADNNITKTLRYLQLQKTTTKKLLRECMAVCNDDSDCKKGLLCSLTHKKELRSLGYDPSRAYCQKVKRPNRQVCYNPKKVTTKNIETNTECPVIPIENEKCDNNLAIKSLSSDETTCSVGPKYCCPKIKERYDDNGKLICGGTLNPSSCYYTKYCQCVSFGFDFDFSSTWMCAFAHIRCPDVMSCYI